MSYNAKDASYGEGGSADSTWVHLPSCLVIFTQAPGDIITAAVMGSDLITADQVVVIRLVISGGQTLAYVGNDVFNNMTGDMDYMKCDKVCLLRGHSSVT